MRAQKDSMTALSTKIAILAFARATQPASDTPIDTNGAH